MNKEIYIVNVDTGLIGKEKVQEETNTQWKIQFGKHCIWVNKNGMLKATEGFVGFDNFKSAKDCASVIINRKKSFYSKKLKELETVDFENFFFENTEFLNIYKNKVKNTISNFKIKTSKDKQY